ncbi:MAG: SRPBCC family protein [Leptolyngbyaceae cyanobacterium]
MNLPQFFWRNPLSHRRSLATTTLAQQSSSRLFYRTYQVLSSAPIETLWQTISNLADISSWHPLINSTNAPRGLMAKPGLIYCVCPRWLPIPIRIFIERVSPQELISVRLFPIPGLEERVIYRLESTVCGTQISYSISLRGWLSPLAWSVLKPFASKVAEAIARAAEDAAQAAMPTQHSSLEG